MEITWTAAPDGARRRATVTYLSRRNTIWTAVSTALMVVAGAIWSITPYGWAVPGQIFVGYWVAGGLLIGWLYRRWLRQLAAAPPAKSESVDATYLVAASGWRATSLYLTTECSWRSYVRTVELDDQFLLMLSRRHAHVLPKAGLSAEAVAGLRAFLTGLDFHAAPLLQPGRPPVDAGMRIEITARFDLRRRAEAFRRVLDRQIRLSIAIGALFALAVRTFLANRDWRVALRAVPPEPAEQ